MNTGRRGFLSAAAPLPAAPSSSATLPCNVGKVVVDAGAMPLSMAGMDLTFPVDVEVEVRNLPADGTPVEVLTAASAVGLRNLRHAPVSGMELPSGKIVKFTFSNGTLMAQLAFEQGFKIVIR